MILNRVLFHDANPLCDPSQNILLRIMALIKDMASCDERNALVVYITDHVESGEDFGVELLTLVYAYRDHYKFGSIGYNNLDNIAQELEKMNKWR